MDLCVHQIISLQFSYVYQIFINHRDECWRWMKWLGSSGMCVCSAVTDERWGWMKWLGSSGMCVFSAVDVSGAQLPHVFLTWWRQVTMTTRLITSWKPLRQPVLCTRPVNWLWMVGSRWRQSTLPLKTSYTTQVQLLAPGNHCVCKQYQYSAKLLQAADLRNWLASALSQLTWLSTVDDYCCCICNVLLCRVTSALALSLSCSRLKTHLSSLVVHSHDLCSACEMTLI